MQTKSDMHRSKKVILHESIQEARLAQRQPRTFFSRDRCMSEFFCNFAMKSLERCVSLVRLVQASERVYNVAQTLQDTADVLHEGGEDAAAASSEASQELEVST